MNWALELDAADAAACGPLRHRPQLEACLAGDRLWLRGQRLDEALTRQLLRLPALCRYTVTTDGALIADGTCVPRGRLPDGRWLPLHCWLPLTPPLARSVRDLPPAGAIRPAVLQLVPADALGEPTILLTDLRTWSAYAVQAPLIRLQRWSFAVNDRAEALVRGLPLPPIPGRRYVETALVAVEAGWTWSPRLEAAALRESLQLQEGDLALLLRSSHSAEVCCEVVPASDFVTATRSAVRRTVAGVQS